MNHLTLDCFWKTTEVIFALRMLEQQLSDWIVSGVKRHGHGRLPDQQEAEQNNNVIVFSGFNPLDKSTWNLTSSDQQPRIPACRSVAISSKRRSQQIVTNSILLQQDQKAWHFAKCKLELVKNWIQIQSGNWQLFPYFSFLENLFDPSLSG